MMALLQTDKNKHTTLAELLVGVELLSGQERLQVTSLTADSRQVVPGSLFLACPGLTVDGRQFMDVAARQGAAAIAAESQGLEAFEIPDGVTVIPVQGLVTRLSAIAGRFYGSPSEHMKVTGITGTNGKTTCSQLLAQLLALLGEPTGVLGTLGYGLFDQKIVNLLGERAATFVDVGMTTPDAIKVQQVLATLLDESATHFCMEVSSHSLDQGRVADVAFHTAIFTNLSRDHLDYHGDMDSYLRAKAQLFATEGLQLAVINADDPCSEHLADQFDDSICCLRFGIDNPKADIVASEVELSDSGVEARLTTPWGTGVLSSRLLGEFNVSNLLAVVAAACGQGHALQEVLALIPRLYPVAGRMEVVSTHYQPVVVVDYAHTPDALEKALESLRPLCRGQLWCVFGCGGNRDAGKRPQMGALAAQLADRAVVTSDNPRGESPEQIIADIRAGMPSSDVIHSEVDRRAAIEYAIANAAAEDCILIAGKGHETYQEVNGVRHEFDDRNEARAVLEQCGQPGGQTEDD